MNKHNRLYATAEPLGDELTKALEDNEIKERDDLKELSKILVGKYDWDVQEAKKIWCFGPDMTGPNVVVENTKGLQYMNEIKDHVRAAF